MKRSLLAAALLAAGLSHVHATDMIITNGKVATMAREGSFAQAVAIKGGVITAVGSNAQVLKLKKPGTQVIDAGGDEEFVVFGRKRKSEGGLTFISLNSAERKKKEAAPAKSGAAAAPAPATEDAYDDVPF